jgi:sulfide:quinone oxidoreductase
MRVVVVGSSFGGLTVAAELRRQLGPRQCEITVVTKDRNFCFIPSLPWVALGRRRLEQISLDLARPLERLEVQAVFAPAERLDLNAKVVISAAGTHPYDHLVIATGHRSANEAVAGLGPFDGPGHSLMSAAEAAEARTAVKALLQIPGPVVVGCAPGASCIGPAYEFALGLDWLLRKRGLRHLVPITFVTPEPYLGHLGMGGAGKVRQFLEGEFESRDIRYLTSVAVTKITDSAVELDSGASLPSQLSLIIPPLAGVDVVAGTAGLANPKGFIPIDAVYRNPIHQDVSAVGVAVALPPADETPIPVNFPKTAHMTEQMAKQAAADIAARLTGRTRPAQELSAACIMDLGNRGVYFRASPVRPPRNRIPRVSDGRRWLWAKAAFERSYLLTVSHGWRLPTRGLGW